MRLKLSKVLVYAAPKVASPRLQRVEVGVELLERHDSIGRSLLSTGWC